MKLIFYKTVQGADGKPVGRRVVTVDPSGIRHFDAAPTAGLPGPTRLGPWREFADFFEIA